MLTVPPRARAALAYVAVFTAAGAIVPYLPLYYRSLGLSLGEVGAMLALASLVGLAASPLWGALSDRTRGSSLVLLAATGTALLGAAMMATFGLGTLEGDLLDPEYLPVPVDRLLIAGCAALLGIGIAGLAPILDARALETAGANREGYGPLRAWGSFAYIIGALGTGVLAEAYGPRSLFVVLGLSLVGTAIIGPTLRPAPNRSMQTVARPLREAGKLFGRRGLGVFVLGSFLCWLGMSMVLSFTPLRFEELGAGPSIVGLGGAIAAGIEVPLMLKFPAIAAKVGAQRLLVLGAAAIALRSTMAALAPDAAVLLAASVFGGIGFAFFFVGGVLYVSEHVPPELAATAQGIFQGIGTSLSQVVAAATGGAIAAAAGLSGLFAVGAALGVLGTLVIVLALRARAQPRPPGGALA